MSILDVRTKLDKIKLGMRDIPDLAPRRRHLYIGNQPLEYEENDYCFTPGCHKRVKFEGYCLDHYVKHASMKYVKKQQVYKNMSTILLPYLLTLGKRRGQYVTVITLYQAS